MAKVHAQVTGGSIQEKEATTVGELQKALNLGSNYTATINGEPASADDELNDYEFVSFALATKGAKVVLRKGGALAYRQLCLF